MSRILVIEDDEDTAGEIRSALEQDDHSVTHVADGALALEQAMRMPFDAITLDRMLPGMDGLTLVSRLRAHNVHVPVLMISAMHEVDDRIAGLRAGGDDYLVKPFAPSEMAARIAVLLRRQQQPSPDAILRAGGIEADLIRRTVHVDGEPVKLLHMEFRLLEFLMRHRGRVVSRQIIFEQVWGYHFDPGANLINVHIARLRKKLERPDQPSAIATVKGEGYRFDAG